MLKKLFACLHVFVLVPVCVCVRVRLSVRQELVATACSVKWNNNESEVGWEVVEVKVFGLENCFLIRWSYAKFNKVYLSSLVLIVHVGSFQLFYASFWYGFSLLTTFKLSFYLYFHKSYLNLRTCLCGVFWGANYI